MGLPALAVPVAAKAVPWAVGLLGLGAGTGLGIWGANSANNQVREQYDQDEQDFNQQLQLKQIDFENQLKLADINQGYGQKNIEAQFNLLGQLKNIEQEQQMLQLKFLQPFAAAENEANRKNVLEQQLLANKATLGAAGINADATKYGADKQFDLGKLQDATQRYGIDKEFELGRIQDTTQRYGIDKEFDLGVKELSSLDNRALMSSLSNDFGNFMNAYGQSLGNLFAATAWRR